MTLCTKYNLAYLLTSTIPYKIQKDVKIHILYCFIFYFCFMIVSWFISQNLVRYWPRDWLFNEVSLKLPFYKGVAKGSVVFPIIYYGVC